MNSKIKPPLRYKEKFRKGKTLSYMFLPPEEPYCNSRCKGCYVLNSDSMNGKRTRTIRQIKETIRKLREKGFSVLPITTEILSIGNGEEIALEAGSEYIMTNGRIIVQNPEILNELKKKGIKQIVITANFDNSGLNLTSREIFEKAVSVVLEKGMELMVRITITKENFRNLESMIEECKKLGIKTIQFLRYLDFEQNGKMLNEQETELFFQFLLKARKKFPEVYLSAGGTFGGKYGRKKKFQCNAGENYFAIGLNGCIYPCIFLTQDENKIGVFDFEKNEIVLDPEYNGLEFREENDCPAYTYLKR